MKTTLSSILLLAITVSASGQNKYMAKEMKFIEDNLNTIEINNKDVSKASIGWHLLHILKVINGIYEEADNSNPENYKSESNIKWFYVSFFGKIPRGKVKSPSEFNPKSDIKVDEIKEELAKARLNIKQWKSLSSKSHYKHPVLGLLNRRKSKRFIKVHSKHHIRIIKDILKQGYN